MGSRELERIASAFEEVQRAVAEQDLEALTHKQDAWNNREIWCFPASFLLKDARFYLGTFGYQEDSAEMRIQIPSLHVEVGYDPWKTYYIDCSVLGIGSGYSSKFYVDRLSQSDMDMIGSRDGKVVVKITAR